MIKRLRIGEIQSEKIECNPYQKNKFHLILKKARNFILNNHSDIKQKLSEICCKVGVAVVFVPELQNIHISGATRWLSSTKAMIVLSNRHKRDDHFWFSFYHEAGHILLHGKKLVFDDDGSSSSQEELEADNFAANILIPEKKYKNFLKTRITRQSIKNRFNIKTQLQ